MLNFLGIYKLNYLFQKQYSVEVVKLVADRLSKKVLDLHFVPFAVSVLSLEFHSLRTDGITPLSRAGKAALLYSLSLLRALKDLGIDKLVNTSALARVSAISSSKV